MFEEAENSEGGISELNDDDQDIAFIPQHLKRKLRKVLELQVLKTLTQLKKSSGKLIQSKNEKDWAEKRMK